MKNSEAHVVEDGDYQHLLVLGAIAAASAFVVTILIVLFCICCQRKSKSKTPLSGEKGTSINMDSKSNGAINSRDSGNGLPGVKGSPLSSLNSTCTQNSNTSECSSILKMRKVIFTGSGEQYIWKSPEDDIVPLQPHCKGSGPQGHPSLPTSEEIANTYSLIFRSHKKRPPVDMRASQTLPRSFGRNKNSQIQVVPDQACPHEEPSYKPIGSCSWVTCATVDPTSVYATLNSHQQVKVDKPTNSTAMDNVLTLNKKKQHGAPAEPQDSGPDVLHFTGLDRVENFCETISNVKQGSNSTCNTTIFTFNDGMEMYVTGL